MEDIGRYLLQIVAAATLCSIVCSLCDKSAFISAVRMIAGVIMVITVAQPILKLRIDGLDIPIEEIRNQGNAYIAQGQADSETAAATIISNRLSEYIEDKASRWGADVTVNVSMCGHVPDEITITGDVSPYVRAQLSAWITAEMGVGEDAQNWN